METYKPFTGMRFSLHGVEFEVVFVAQGKVRYASTAGGRQYILSTSDFSKIIKSENAISHAENNSINFTKENAQGIIRKNHYIKEALQELRHPTSRKKLRGIITKVSEAIHDQKPPSVSTVTKWIQSYQKNGNESLPPKKHQGNTVLRFSPEVESLITEAIEVEFLSDERRDALDVQAYIVGKLYERENLTLSVINKKIPSVRTIQRRIRKIDPYILEKSKNGKRIADKNSRAAGQVIYSYAALSDVQIDTHMIDLLVVDPDTQETLGRPYLTFIQDIKTRAEVGRYICMYPPSATTSLAALIDMITRPNRGLPGGIPSKITPDNGVEFKNTSFMHLCEQLSITITPAPVYEPNAKAHVESFFRTLTRGVIQKLPGTTFSNINERGDYQSEKKAMITLEKLEELIDEWINEVYHKSIHSRTGRAPLLSWKDETKLFPPLFISNAEAHAIARRPVPRTIQNGQVQIDYIHYYSHSLSALNAQGVTHVIALVNDLNLQDILIKNPLDDNHLITANSTDPEYTTGLTFYMHEEAQKIKKEMTALDLKRLGPLANIFARWKLLEKIQNESNLAKRWIKKLTNGKGRVRSSVPAKINSPQANIALEQAPLAEPLIKNTNSSQTETKLNARKYKSIFIE